MHAFSWCTRNFGEVQLEFPFFMHLFFSNDFYVYLQKFEDF